MAVKYDSLAHTKYYTRYHLVFVPKYRRKAIYGEIRKDISDYLKRLCKYKGIEIIEGHMMIDHVHMLVSIPPKYSVSQVVGYIKGKSALMIFLRIMQKVYQFTDGILCFLLTCYILKSNAGLFFYIYLGSTLAYAHHTAGSSHHTGQGKGQQNKH